MSKQLYIIRHGETDFNRNHIVQGRGMDTHLNAFGQRQARAFYESYKNEGFDFVYTSNLKRTQQTVEAFALEKGLPFKALYCFDEFNWGIYEGTRFGEFSQEYRDLIAAWSAGDIHAAPPCGESPFEVSRRLKRGLRLIQENPAEKILLCMHGRAMRLFLCILLDLPFSKMEQFEHQNLSLYQLELRSQGALLLKANDLLHLQEVRPD
ncbi:MAG: histidine phosphatase family protein [Bacteroidia bacterium]